MADYTIPRQSDVLLENWFNKQSDPLPPWMRQGTKSPVTGVLSATPERPSDWAVSSGLAETLSPIAQGYGAGQMAGDAYQAARAGDYGTAAGGGLLAAMSMAPMKKGAPVAAAKKPAGIRGYHGSPYDFEKFDMSKIGTGEGAQAYGHGLYFAENEGVAKQYRNKLADRPDVLVGGEVAKPATDVFAKNDADATVAARLSSWSQVQGITGDAQGGSAAAVAKVRGDIENGLAMAQRRGDFDLWSRLNDQKIALDRFEERGIDFKHKGRMYEVNINADPSHFLDWDKPLSQQSEKVRQAIEKVAPPKSRDEIQAAHDAYKQANADWMARPENVDTTTAAALENAVGDAYKNWRVAQGLSGSGSRIYTDLARGKPYSEGANALRDAGIPGIKYLDQGSRGAGDGSRNYVVFDPATIEILRKYGILGPMAGGVAAGAMQQPGILGDQ